MNKTDEIKTFTKENERKYTKQNIKELMDEIVHVCRKHGEAAALTNKELKTVTVFYATSIYCNCPECGEDVEGWYSDPRGVTTTCDYCECYK